MNDSDFWKQRAEQYEAALKLIWQLLTDEQRVAVADACRTTEGVCFCGCHTGCEIME